PSRRCAVLRPPRQEGEGPSVQSRGPNPRPPDRQAGVWERGRDDLRVRRDGGRPSVPRTEARPRESHRRARQDDGRVGTAEGTEGRGRPREGDRTPPGRRLPREGRADPAPDADLLPHPEPDRVPLLRCVVPETARVPRRPPTPGPGDGVPSDAAPAARPRLDRQPEDRLADHQDLILTTGYPTLVLITILICARAPSREIPPTGERP